MPDHAPYRSGETARHFRRLYLVALSLIAALAIGGQLLVQRSLTLQLDDGHVVNQAGYQRMLSQRITLKMMLLDADGPGTRSDVATIAAMRDRWLATHRQLLDRVARIAHNDDARQALRHLFAEAGQPLQRISSLVTRRMERGGLSATERAGLLADQELFLPLMDAIVLGLEH
ncbi:MAG TPA: type IV pili methyl-accepting chemotaxis transducer N-terminal domain-containing protein, partial [Lacunisphaera sp.]|nr:type IV pili methyl-accepting chemotaxis transducer N-terminal domain-containing protein [Lacunisphaera sp.]